MLSLKLFPGIKPRLTLLAGALCLVVWTGVAIAADRTVLGELYSAEM